ncbi:MAG: ATP-dependent DNA ligase [Candidatus Aenigmatarchaeota archaeon]
MRFFEVCEIYEKLEKITSKIGKTEILANLFKKAEGEELKKLVLLSTGQIFLPFENKELGVASKLVMRSISKASGFDLKNIEELYVKFGDLGKVAEYCIKNRKQKIFFKKELTVSEVYDKLREIGLYEGEGSQDRKISTLAGLLNFSNPLEARYLVRIVLDELRIGVAEGIIRDAIVMAFFKSSEKEKALYYVDFAWNILGDFGEVAKIAKHEGIEGLKKVKPVLGIPIQVMLGIKAESIEEVIKRHGKIIAEFKYDGLRMQIHKQKDKVWIFTRRLEDVTKQFPDVVEIIRKNILADECIIEGEAWPIDINTKLPMPFQKLSQRIHRKYDIEKMSKEIPVQLNLFDIIYLNGETFFEIPLIKRREILKNIVKEEELKIQLAESIYTDNVKEIEEFYNKSLSLKQEGIMLKNPQSFYIFGRHVGGWYKIKPIMETLDVVIVGAEYGEGSRSKWLSSYLFAVRDEDTGELLTCGMGGTGLTEEQFELMTEILTPLIIKREGNFVWVKPKIVVEVSYQEIQKSPNYTSGYALRFPRIERIREDKSVNEIDTLKRLEELYKSQGKAG